MTLQFTTHGRSRATIRNITEDMIMDSINKLHPDDITDRKIYLIDKTLNYTLVADICRNKVIVITIITEKGFINITGRNPMIRSVS